MTTNLCKVWIIGGALDMKNSIGVLSVSKFYHSAVKAALKRRGFQKNTAKKIIKTHKEIMNRAKEIGNSRLVSSYVMGSYFIAMNRSIGKSPEENYRYSEMDFVLRLYSGK